jgi:hypothetical protein
MVTKLTIIPSDKAVYKDGGFYTNLDALCNCGIPEGIHALQWNNGSGWIEYVDPNTPNEDITELPNWATNACQVFDETDYINKHPPPPAPPEAWQNKNEAIQRLYDTDYTVLPDVNISNKAEFETYRAALREIVFNPPEGYIEWPVKPDPAWIT